MSYLQRLVDAAAPVAPAVAPAASRGGAGPSPFVAMDQRLDLFPGLIDPVLQAAPEAPIDAARKAGPRDAPRHDQGASPPAERSQADRAPPPQTEPADAAGRNDPVAPDAARQHAAHNVAAAGDGAGPAEAPPALPPISPWQRLVEEAPLAAPLQPSDFAALFPAGPGQQAASPAAQQRSDGTAEPQGRTPDHRRPQESPARHDARGVEARMRRRPAAADAPWPIPTDALQPVGAPEMAAMPVQSRSAAVPRRDGAAEPARLPRRAEPAVPPRDGAMSPLSGPAQTPAVTLGRAQALAMAGQSEAGTREVRIIERIREVPAAAPPKRLTAAEASVIGPLKGRRIGRRHFMFGRG